MLYWIEHSSQSTDKIIEYNAATHTSRHITLPSSCQALALSIGVDKILLMENPESMQDEKTIVEVLNQDWNGEEL